MPATTGRLLQAILASAPEGTLARLAHRHIRRGEHLVREGTVLDTLYAVETGRFSALRSALKLAEIGVGEAIGEISFLTGDPATADVVALRDSVVLTLDRAVFDEICAQSPAVAQAVAAELATRLAVTNARVAADPTPPLIRTLAVVPVAGQALPDGFAARLAQGWADIGTPTC